ncbi:unnamed protein product [Eruca vesicaria subsp. sativa]|uniref:Ubiquitin-like domain-containing protein n=1 Tax=Eruca vesicaria subsp. sativa TaxID=29727 RepID=A0ABC8JS77_ERUVS|nr:unnamed protein product [Eruca vesicaria subsp. sativa]
MLLFVDTAYGSTFYIELNLNDKVLDIKNKIENSQGIPVSMQTLYYNGEPLLLDYLDLNTYNIVANSRLFLVLPHQEDNNNSQVLLQPTDQQSLAPSTSVQDSLGEFQDWSATARSIFRRQMLDDQPEQSPAPPAMARHDDKNQDLLQSELPSPSDIFGEDLLLPTELFSNIQSHLLNSTTDKSIDNSNVFNKEQSSNTFGFAEDPPLPTEFFSNIGSQWSTSTTAKSIDNSNVFNKEQSSTTFGFPEDPPLPEEFFRNIGSHSASTTEKSIDNSNLFNTEQSSTTFGDLLFDEDPPLPAEVFNNIGSHSASTTEKSMDNSNVSHTEQSTSNTFGDLLFDEDSLAAEFFSNIGSHRPASTTEKKSIDNSNLFHTEQSSTTFEDSLFGEDPLFPAEHFADIASFMPESTTEDIFINKQPPAEKSPKMKEVINVPDSPAKVRRFRRQPQRMRVMILPHSPDNEPVSKVPVSVVANENVEELRKELEKLRERNELKLPEKGYFFIHKQEVLDDDKSFLWNGVAHGDTIEIFPGYVTKEGRTFGI